MNTIFWKGVFSTTIEGLLISELPPISKPPMRVKETMIDGRDGSIIEDLGYEPYNKPVTIGLRGNFDINKVIKYFTGEGEIIFSNEPDKVYTAKVISQIDYNRLLRFRTAVVQFRVQPYKYKHNEAYKETQTATATGTSIAVTDSAEVNLKTFRIYGKSTQDGTPTPDSPIDIEVVSGTFGVKVTGKNILDYAKNLKTTLNGLTSVLNADGSITTTGMPTVDYTGISYLGLDDVLTDGKTYTISQKSGGKVFLQVNIQDKSTGTYQYISGKGSFVADLTKYSYAANIQTSTLQSIGTEAINETNFYQIEEGEKATDFEPYKKRIVMWYISDEFMADQDYFENGVLNKKIGKLVFDGSESSWEQQTYESFVRFRVVVPTMDDMGGEPTRSDDIKCDRFLPSKLEGHGVCFRWQNSLFFYPTEDITTLDEWLAWLADNPITVYYPLLTPTQIDLAKVLNPEMFEPNTVITSNNDAEMEIEYFKVYEVFNEGLESSRPLVVLKGSGTVGISVNGVHIFDYTFPDGESEVVIDSEKEDAYLGNVLKNRNMNGEFPILLVGTNKIEWSGDVESIEILPRSRWL